MQRDEIATHLMAALLVKGLPEWATTDANGWRDWGPSGYARAAVEAADALLEALEGK